MEENGNTQTTLRLLSFKDVENLTGMSRSTINRLVKRGDFPRPRLITERKVGFLEADLEKWIHNREFAS